MLLNFYLDILKCDFQFSSGERIAFLTPNNAVYTICQWSVWLNGGIGVPLSPKYPLSELKYLVENSRSSLVISTSQYHDVRICTLIFYFNVTL